ncbi:MAG: DNA-processing protein DprA [Planctomycetota bacterium]
MSVAHWLRLRLAQGIGPTLAQRLVDFCGNVADAAEASARTLQNIKGIGGAKASSIETALRVAREDVKRELDLADRLGVAIIHRDDPSYPMLLAQIPDPPSVLWVRGELTDAGGIGVVGSRDCSTYGRGQAERFATWLAGAGFTIISGGARGIDAAAHRGALRHPDGRTIAVLGCGVDVAYPREHEPLYAEIAERGCVLSDYPLRTPPIAQNFPPRNRIISGLSRGVLVVEAAARSGASITARLAATEHGRTVFALPGQVDNPLSHGPHQLIRDGATLVTEPADIPGELGPLPDMPPREATTLFEPQATKALPALSDEERTVVDALEATAADADTLADRSGLPIHVVTRCLTTLTLKGVAERAEGNQYRRISS